MNQLETPVAFIVFNRPETTRRVFATIAAARPTHLLIVADGPRDDRSGESERCEEVRRIVNKVDWPCRVDRNFAEQNMGCRRRVVSGLNWVFSLVEEAIILEDDCLPDPSFFPFCSELLERYRYQVNVGLIGGFNPLEKNLPCSYSYFFSVMVNIWGWATWRRAWLEYDENIRTWPDVKSSGVLRSLFPNKRAATYWTHIFDAMYAGTGPNTWDYQWAYTCWTRSWLLVLPSRNLVQNIGVGADATHTATADADLLLSAGQMNFPLKHQPAIMAWPGHAKLMQSRFYTPGILPRIKRKLLSQIRSVAK